MQANILINQDHRACLADFGLSTIAYVARHITPDMSSKVSRISVDSKVSLMPYLSGGTIRWMSPELLNPERFRLKDCRPTKQSDCYALGMVIYEVRGCSIVLKPSSDKNHQVLCGEKPYLGYRGDLQIQIAIGEGVRPGEPDEAATLGFTDGLWWIVECCWMEERDIRPNVKAILLHLTHAASAWDKRPRLGDSILIR